MINIGAFVCMQAATQTAIRTMQNSQRRRREQEKQKMSSNSNVKRSSNFEEIIEDATKEENSPN